ncbi:unnamed protein product, partial [Didymodactylos carnosus]
DDDNNVIYSDENKNNNFNIIESNVDNDSMDLELSRSPSFVDIQLLHDYTSLTTDEFCSKLLNVFRDSSICKSHSNRSLSLIQSALPIQNNLPRSMEKVLQKLNIDDNLFRKRLICTLCNKDVAYSEKRCLRCKSSNDQNLVYVYDTDIGKLIHTIVTRLYKDIQKYKHQLEKMNDSNRTNDIGFNKLYQQLL